MATSWRNKLFHMLRERNIIATSPDSFLDLYFNITPDLVIHLRGDDAFGFAVSVANITRDPELKHFIGIGRTTYGELTKRLDQWLETTKKTARRVKFQ